MITYITPDLLKVAASVFGIVRFPDAIKIIQKLI